MKALLKDIRNDIALMSWEVVVVLFKVTLVYTIIKMSTDMPHDQGLEVAILVGAVDFLNIHGGERSRTITDLKTTIKTKYQGRTTTTTKDYHKREDTR